MVEFNGGMSPNTLYQALESHIQKQRGVEKRDMERSYKTFQKKESQGREKLFDLMSCSLNDLQKILADHIDWEQELYSDIVTKLGFDFESLFGTEFSYSKVARMLTLLELVGKALNEHTEDLTNQLKAALGDDVNV